MVDLTDRPVLLVEGGPNGAKAVPLGRSTMIGRQSDNDVVVPDVGVSRQHVRIVRTEEGYHLRDLGSTNGTYLNDTKIAHGTVLLRDGDQIRLGVSKIRLVFRHTDSITVTTERIHPSTMRVETRKTKLGGDLVGSSGSGSFRSDHRPVEDNTPHLDNTRMGQDGSPRESYLRLNVQVEGSVGLVINLLKQLQREPELRSLRLDDGHGRGAKVWEALREPTGLEHVISQMETESKMGRSNGGADWREGVPSLTVVLKEPKPGHTL